MKLPKQTVTSRLVGHNIELPTPCGDHVIYYPRDLALAAWSGVYFPVFMTSCECNIAYLIVLETNCARIRMGGIPQAIEAIYESFDWPEAMIGPDTPPSASGANAGSLRSPLFIFKKAPSLHVVNEAFDRITAASTMPAPPSSSTPPSTTLH